MSDLKTTQMYVCPMHPDVTSDKPGRCSKCGMALVKSGDIASMSHAHNDTSDAMTWRSYAPLMVILFLITMSAVVVSWRGQSPANGFIPSFMTGFFLVFAGFKLIDLKGFAEGYYSYDLLAQRWFGYGYIYPFIELGFGLLMLARYTPTWLLWAEFGVMIFSGIGVAIKIARREKFRCACLGTFLKVPLTYVTLIEDFGMAVLALVLILRS